MTNPLLFLLIIFVYFPASIMAGFMFIAILEELFKRRIK